MRQFPVGYRDFHAEPTLNFPLNRWLPYWDESEISELAKSIRNLGDWQQTMLEHAHLAEARDRSENAAYFYRAAEFFMDWSEPDKYGLYQSFLKNFYESVRDFSYEAHDVPFGDHHLPALTFSGDGDSKGMIVIHGGFDSAMEEFFDMAVGFAEVGFDVILFEGPGQGRVLHESGLAMSPDWHLPTAAILDHFEVTSCSLLGISLGGCLALRAAAKEHRIEQVILCDVLEDFLDCMTSRLPGAARGILNQCLRVGAMAPINWGMRRAGEKTPFTGWALQHGMVVSGSDSPAGFLGWLRGMNTRDVSSMIHQDVLILAGAEDHLVPLRQLSAQIVGLTAARSITTRTFSKAEHAQNHCQIGNLNLMLNVVQNWLTFQSAYRIRNREM